MNWKLLKTFAVIIVCLSTANMAFSQKALTEQEKTIGMRMIGHQVLLSTNDSTSRVLPIIKEDRRYKIAFENEFAFEPGLLASIIDSAVTTTNLPKRYIVEVEDCQSFEIVYSFKVDAISQQDIVPCGMRMQPKGCYNLFITLIEPNTNNTIITQGVGMIHQANTNAGLFKYLSYAALLVMFLSILFFLWKRNQNGFNPDLISLGQYQFDKRNTELILENQRIELTTKEADLLLLLYNSANTTVEREVILNKIWEDEGHYVGRTLDVFISKLRKKLEFDTQVKIVNIRGVGYKLVMNS